MFLVIVVLYQYLCSWKFVDIICRSKIFVSLLEKNGSPAKKKAGASAGLFFIVSFLKTKKEKELKTKKKKEKELKTKTKNEKERKTNCWI